MIVGGQSKVRAQAQPDEAASPPQGGPSAERGFAASADLERAGGPGGRELRGGGASVPSARMAGFTLIELLVVIGVVALLAALATPALGSLTGANVRKAAGELAGAMRVMFDTAALRHSTCRIGLDLDGRSWSAECARGPAAIAAADAKGEEEDDSELERRFPDEKNPEVRRLLAKSPSGAFEDRLVEKRELPGRTVFGRIHVEGRDAAEEGKVYVYFFPGGQAQRAYVPVVDGDNLYTVVVEPFTGRSRVVIGKVEVRE